MSELEIHSGGAEEFLELLRPFYKGMKIELAGIKEIKGKSNAIGETFDADDVEGQLAYLKDCVKQKETVTTVLAVLIRN